jgi:hypothetical protein
MLRIAKPSGMPKRRPALDVSHDPHHLRAGVPTAARLELPQAQVVADFEIAIVLPELGGLGADGDCEEWLGGGS